MKRLCLLIIVFAQVFCLEAQTQEEMAILSKMNEASALEKEKKYVAAGDAYMELNRMITRPKTDTERDLRVMALIKASSNYYLSKDSCERGYEIAKALMSESLSDKHMEMAKFYYSLNGTLLAMRCLNGGNRLYAKSRSVAKEVLPYASDKVKTSLNKTIAKAWYFEGSEAFRNGNFAEAYSCFENAVQEYELVGNLEDVVKSKKYMADCLYWQYKYKEALALYEKAYNKAEEKNLAELQIEILNEKKTVYKSLDDREGLAETVATISNILNAHDDLSIPMYTLLGDDAADIGDYYVAETYYLKALELGSQKTDATIPLLYGKLVDVMRKAKEYSRAIAYEEKRVEAVRKITPSGARVYGEYRTLASIYADMGDKENALVYADKYIESVAGEPTRTVAEALTMSGITKGRVKEYKSAIADLSQAEKMLAKEYGNNDPERMRVLALVSGLRSQLELYSESREGYRQYYEWTKSVYGKESAEACQALCYLANIEALCGDVELGEQYYIESTNKYLQIIKNNLKSVSSAERESYWNSVSENLWNMTAFAIKGEASNDDFTEACYNSLLFSKSLLLTSEKSMYEVLQKNGTAEDLSDYSKMVALQAQIKELSREYDDNKDKIGQLNIEKSSLDRKLVSKCKAYNDYTAFLDIKFKDIREALGENEVVIDFTDFVKINGEHVYAAYIIRHSEDHPTLLRLFSEDQIESLLGDNHTSKLYSDILSPKASDMIWTPLRKYVPDGAMVYYVPSGMMHQIAIESLALSDATLLGERYNFVRLSSAREVLDYDDGLHVSSDYKATLIGGLTYEVDGNDMMAESKKYDISPLLATRGGNRDYNNQEPFRYLDNSLPEVKEVAEVLKNKTISVSLLTGKEGTEEAFLAMTGDAPDVLLVSTHGFYYTADKNSAVSYLSGYDDAMSLTGLIMAGANRAWRGDPLPESVQSGILTASKIARLDLGGNEIVALSACQTGQGEATPEGVYGLQRAFKKAGVQTIIMTLWSVSDLSTKEFMTTFFQRLSENGWHKHEAFEYAKQTIRSKYEEPYYWAPFVMLD